jgi:F0F1-type ATP synthase epsilon subunit
MAKLIKGSVQIEVPDNEVRFYLRAGYLLIDPEPVKVVTKEPPKKVKKFLQSDSEGDEQ